MPETAKEKIDGILTSMSDLMGVKIEFVQDGEDQGKVIPAFDINAILSKMVGLCVFSGLSVPSSFAPTYNRVNADIEWWKKTMAELENSTPAAETHKTEEVPEGGG